MAEIDSCNLVSLTASVVGGLAAGTALVGLLAVLPIPYLNTVVSPEHRSWVAKNVTQCNEPWDNLEPVEGQTKYDVYFSARGVRIYDVQYVRWAPDDVIFCAACDCASGSTLYLEVARTDIDKMSRYGFIEKQPPD